MIKKLLFSFAAIVCSCVSVMADTDISTLPNTLYFKPVTMTAGETTNLVINMKNNEDVQSIGTYIDFPEGFGVVKGKRKYEVNLIQERTDLETHAIFSNFIEEDRLLKVGILQQAGYPFEGNDGPVFSINVAVDKDVKPGDYTIRIYEIEFSGLPHEGQDVPGTIYRKGEFEGTVTVLDPTGVNNVSADAADEIEGIYTAGGVKIEKTQNGFNLIKKKDGKVIKIAK